ncbi:MAG TPA: glycosyltransferase, partial [Blastocatellia bacterium]
MNKHLKIWHLSEGYPPDYGGGAMVTVWEVCQSLARRGHQVRVLCADGSGGPPYSIRTDFDGEVRVDRISLPYFKHEDPDGWRLNVFAWRRHQKRIGRVMSDLLDEWMPDIVDYHTVRPFGEEALFAIHAKGIPISATLHEGWLICPRLMLLRSPVPGECSGPSALKCLNCIYSYYDGSMSRAILKLPWRVPKLGLYPAYRLWQRSRARAAVTAAAGRSEFMARVHRPHIAGPVHHVQLGINMTGLTKDERERPANPLRFGFVGGFQQTKGIDHILSACRSLKESGLDFELHVWGPGTEGDAARSAIAGLEDRVFLRGMYSAGDLWKVYGEMDVT